jgi:hypothetical protein
MTNLTLAASTVDNTLNGCQLDARVQANVTVMRRRFEHLEGHLVRNIGYGRGHSAELCLFWERVADEMARTGAATLGGLPLPILTELERERQLALAA